MKENKTNEETSMRDLLLILALLGLSSDDEEIKEKIAQKLREDNDNLRYKNELYLEKIKKLEGEE